MAIDGSDNVHITWYDTTNLEGCGTDYDIFYANYSATTVQWSHAKVIKDNINGTINWNTGESKTPDIAAEGSGNVHVAWYDKTNLEGSGTDADIFYANYTDATGQWSHAKVISDNINGTINWNTGDSRGPSIAVENSGNVHIAWHDYTNLEGSGTDADIFYANYTATTRQWSHTKVISDNVNGTINWNTKASLYPAITIDGSENVHVVWDDRTNLEGSGTDADIFYAHFSAATGQWSHVKVISDNVNGTINWNTEGSFYPAIAVDGSGNVHITWEDNTNLEGCSPSAEQEIFYAKGIFSGGGVYLLPGGDDDDDDDKVATIPFGNYYLIFALVSIIILIAYKRYKL